MICENKNCDRKEKLYCEEYNKYWCYCEDDEE